MKKFAWLLIVGIIFCLNGCAQQEQTTTIDQSTEYIHSHWVKASDLREQTVIHEGLTRILPDLKELVNEAFSGSDYLDWVQFGSVTEIREFKNPNLFETFTDTTAFYAAGSHMIVVCPNFFNIKDSGQQTYILIHELMHSLIGVGKNGSEETMNCFMEGIADYMANQVLFDTGLKYNLVYQNELYCISWLMALYGNEDVVKMICSGDMPDFISEQTGDPDAGMNLHSSLAIIDKSKDHEAVKNAILTEMDILKKMSRSNTKVCEQFTNIFEKAYAPYLN